METKNLNEIAEEIRAKNEKLRSLNVFVDEENEKVCLQIDKYRGGENGITAKQEEYIFSFANASWQSNSCVRQMNKWCASAIIDALKTYEDTKFFICK